MALLPPPVLEAFILPAVLVGSLLAAFVIIRISNRHAGAQPRVPAPASASVAVDVALHRAQIKRCLDGLNAQFSEMIGAGVRSIDFGALEISPTHLDIWFITDSDAQRQHLLGLPDFDRTCHAALAATGYPAEAVPHVRFHAESEETVQRDWGGNWWHVFR